jgi:hypothetical protein
MSSTLVSTATGVAVRRGLRYTPGWYKGSGRLSGKIAVVTGAGGPIGQAVSIAFAREGADVLLAFSSSATWEALETSSWIERAGRVAILSPCTATTESGCEELVQLAVKCFGSIDIIANTDDVPDPTINPAPISPARVGRSADLLFAASAAHMPPGGAITDTFCAKDDLYPRGDIYEAEAALSALAFNCTAKSLRANGVSIGTPRRYRRYFTQEATLPAYLAEVATAHVACATHTTLNGTIFTI